MKRYLGKIEAITAERFEQFGWEPEAARQMVKEGQTEQRVYVAEDGDEKLLAMDDVAIRHSPDGFAWGYQGSGPTALARMILVDYAGENPEPGLVIDFRDAKLAALDQDEGFDLSGDEVEAFLRERHLTA